MTDNVNHPTHYADGWSNGAEVIDITENLNFNRGNAVKYTARAGRKDPATELEDLKKARWYLDREIERLEGTTVWTLSTLREQLWETREQQLQPTREWKLLDHVPPGVIVEDKDGDRYRRIGGTAKFAIAMRDVIYPQHYEWQDVWPFLYRDQELYGPFKEVISG